MGQILKLKLLRTVSFWTDKSGKFEHLFFPPLALGVLYAQLKRHGYDVSQDDLSMRVHHDHFNFKDKRQFNREVFFEADRIVSYVVSGIDDYLENELSKMIEGIDLKEVDVFLLSMPESLFNHSNMLFVLAFSKYLKKYYDSYIVLGGHFVSLMLLLEHYKSELNKVVDFIVVEDGEEAILDVLNKISDKHEFKNGNGVNIVSMPHNNIVTPDFSGLPFEKYSFSFIDSNLFLSNRILKEFFSSKTLILPLQFIKGCPNRCAFCGSSMEGLRSFLSPEEVVNAIMFLQDKFMPTGYFFLNNTLNISRGYIEKLCDLLMQQDKKILWSDCMRVNGIDEDLIIKLKKSGCIRLILGLESASTRQLERLNKRITVQGLERVLRLACKHGIWTGVEIICGLPFETTEDIDVTIDFLLKNKAYIDRTYCNIFDLRDKSFMREYPEDYGIENIHTLNIYAKHNEIGFNSCNFIRYGFDEKNGLKWENKKEQMVNVYQRILNETDAGIKLSYGSFLEEHLLFFLYSWFDDKVTIKRYYDHAVEFFNKLVSQ